MCIMAKRSKLCPDVTVVLDACGSWGCGACSSGQFWFQLQWPESWYGVHITVKELLPIVVACALWGKSWGLRTVKFRCDNAAVVAIINSSTSKDKLAMHLMRCLAFFRAHYNFYMFAEHIPGKLSVATDSLSRDKLPLFFQVMPQASCSSTPIFQELQRALLLDRPDWISPIWRTLFTSILNKV